MQFPITIGLRRSFFLGMATALAHMLAVVVVLVPPWSGGLKAVVLLGIAVSAILAMRRRRPAVECLRLLGDGRLECRVAGENVLIDAELLPSATVHPWLTVVPLRIAGRKATITILPDSMPADEFHRLRVWLRWRAEFSGAKGVA